MRLLLLLGILVLVPAGASAQALVICNIGGPGSTKQARPVLEKFLRHVEKVGGLKKGSMRGEYHTTPAACQEYIKREKPLFAVFDLATYLSQRKALKLKPLGCMGSPTGQRYHLLVREGSYKNLAALKGKKLISSHLRDMKFVSKIIFDGKIDAAKHFEIKATRRPLKGIRKVARQKADATLVDKMAYDHLGELKLPAKLVSIHRSSGLPGLTLAVLGTAKPDKAAVKKVTSALPKLCAGPGKSLCKTFQVTAFSRVKAATFRKLAKKYR
jgi:hypothetical protein